VTKQAIREKQRQRYGADFVFWHNASTQQVKLLAELLAIRTGIQLPPNELWLHILGEDFIHRPSDLDDSSFLWFILPDDQFAVGGPLTDAAQKVIEQFKNGTRTESESLEESTVASQRLQQICSVVLDRVLAARTASATPTALTKAATAALAEEQIAQPSVEVENVRPLRLWLRGFCDGTLFELRIQEPRHSTSD